MDTYEGAVALTAARRWAGTKDGARSEGRARLILEHLPAGAPLSAVTDEVLDAATAAWEAEGVGPATINRRLAAIGTVFSVATRLARNEGVRRPALPRRREPRGRTRVLTDAEVEALVAGCAAIGPASATYGQLTLLLLNTGMRVSEALGFDRAAALRDGSVFLKDTKSGRSRTVPLNAAAVTALRRIGCQRLTASRFSKVWLSARKAAGLDGDPEVVPHALRHTFASRLVQRGVDIAVVSRLLGHSSLEMTMRYAHYNTATMADAVNVL